MSEHQTDSVWLWASCSESELERVIVDIPARLELIRTTKPSKERPERTVTIYSVLEIREFDSEDCAFFQLKHVPAIQIETTYIGDETYRSVKVFDENRDAWANNFQLTINKHHKTAQFGPKSWIMVQPCECKGRGIGSYAMGKVVAWGKEKYPDYSPLPIDLSTRDGNNLNDPENRDRRNRFYERFGFEMNYHNSETKISGKALIEKLSVLSVPDSTLEKIEVLSMEDTLKELLTQRNEHERIVTHLSRANHELDADVQNKNLSIVRRNKIIAFLIFLPVAAFVLWWYGYILLSV